MTVKELYDALDSLVNVQGKGDIQVLQSSTEGSNEHYLVTDLVLLQIPNAQGELVDVLIIRINSNKEGSTTIPLGSRTQASSKWSGSQCSLSNGS